MNTAVAIALLAVAISLGTVFLSLMVARRAAARAKADEEQKP